MLKITFFGKFSELAESYLQANKLSVEYQPAATPADIVKQIAEPFPEFISELQRPNTLFAVNHDMAKASTPLSDGDELAIMPPVSGG